MTWNWLPFSNCRKGFHVTHYMIWRNAKLYEELTFSVLCEETEEWRRSEDPVNMDLYTALPDGELHDIGNIDHFSELRVL
jgi:hypothetical protein